MVKKFESKTGPKALGPYSHGTVFKEVIYLSGQIGINPQSNQMVPGGIEAETRQVMENIQNMLEEAGSNLSHVIRCRIYVTDLKDFDLINEIYGEYLGEAKPSRSCVQVAALPKGALVEIECTAKIETYFN